MRAGVTPIPNLLLLVLFLLFLANGSGQAANGNALFLDGVNDYALAASTVFPNSTFLSPLTVEAWIYPTASATAFIATDDAYNLVFFFQSGAANNGLGMRWVLYHADGSSQSITEFRGVQLNQWNHVAGIYDIVNGQMKMAINGVLSTSPAPFGSSFLFNPNINFTVGSFGGSGFFKSYIDEVRVSDTVRYSGPFTPQHAFTSDANTRGLWHFNETAGSTTLADSSGGGHPLSGLNGAQAAVAPALPNPTVASVIRSNPANQTNNATFVTWLVTFSKQVTGVDLADFTLVDVAGTIVNEFLGNVSNFTGTQIQVTANTGSGGGGDLRLDVLAGTATINDLVGNPLINSFTSGQVFTVDKVRPTVTDVVDVSPDPRTTPVDTVDVIFSEPVLSFGFGDLSFTRNGAAVTLNNTVTTAFVSGTTYRVSGLGAFTTAPGGYVLTVNASGVFDSVFNSGTGSASDSWTTVFPADAIIYVDAAYGGANPSGTFADPFRTVGEGHQAAVSGNTIRITSGTYPELIAFSGKVLRVESTNGVVIIGHH